MHTLLKAHQEETTVSFHQVRAEKTTSSFSSLYLAQGSVI